MRWQSIVKTTHVWIGLVLGALLCLTCLSGSIIVFRPQLEAVFSPRVAPSEARADLDLAVAHALAVNRDAKLTRVLLPEASRNTIVLTLESGEKRQRKIVVDAGTGAIAGRLDVLWLDWIVDLHHNLLFGRTGRQVVGLIGIVLFVMSVTGLVLWLLRNASWKALVSVRAGGSKRRFYYELHRATGLWANAFLILLSFTGVALAYPDVFRMVLGKPVAISKSKQSANRALRPLTEYLNISRAAVNGAELTELRLPKSPKDPINVRFRVASDLGNIGRNEISIDAAGRVLGIRRIADESAGARIQASFTPIHYGENGGIAIRAVWSLAGVAPTLLFITGILVWFRKKPRRSVEQNRSLEEPEREFLMTRQSL
jgi:uncharacterized iron-regulated membrane protein